MKNKKYLLLLTLPLLLAGCGNTPASSSDDSSTTPSTTSESTSEEKGAPVKKYVEAEMVSHFGENQFQSTYKDTCYYDDTWFYKDSYELNYDLAAMSAMVGGTSYSYYKDRTPNRIKNLLGQMGYTNVSANEYYTKGIMLEDSMGVTIGQKKIVDDNNKEFTLLAVFPRSAGYEDEWVGNFNVGESGMHEGFLLCRDEVLRFMKHYISEQNIAGNLKVWLAGYSRGAAAINLLGGFLGEENNYFGNTVSLNPKDIYSYSIGTPRTTVETIAKKDLLSVSGPRGEGYNDTDVLAYTYQGEGNITVTNEKYNYIHNFTAYGDFVTKLPSKDWGFTRFGDTNMVEYGDENMLNFLRELSPETADMFKDKNYRTEVSKKTFDLTTFEIVDTNEKISADELIEERFTSLFKLAESREGLIENKYNEILGNFTAIFGTDWSGFINGIMADTGAMIKAGVLTYLAHVVEATGLEENEAVAKFAEELMALAGKTHEEEVYTDQQFLADLLDYLFNDYSKTEAGKKRVELIASFIPEAYRPIVTGVFDYAKDHEMTLKTFDDLVLLLASYLNDNKSSLPVALLIALLSTYLPDDKLSLIMMLTNKTYTEEDYPDIGERKRFVMLDLIDAMVNGVYNDEGEQTADGDNFRALVITFGLGMSMPSECTSLFNLLTNGIWNGTGEDKAQILHEPAPLSLVVEDILTLAMPKDEEGKRLSLDEAADQAVKELLLKGRTNTNGKFVDNLVENPAGIRKIIVAILLNPGETYSLAKELENAVTFITGVEFLYPVHNHEMYICYLKTKVSWRKN